MRKPTIQARVVSYGGPGAHEDRVVAGAEEVCHGFGFWAGEESAYPGAEGELAVEGLGVGESCEGT